MVIVVGYRDTEEGRAALERAEQEARLRDASLHIVRSMRLTASDDADRAREWSRHVDEARTVGDQIVAGLRDRGVTADFDVDTTSASAAQAVLSAARERGAGLIVIGVRRRSPVGKLVLGSVSQDVLLHADCPVMAVKAQPD